MKPDHLSGFRVHFGPGLVLEEVIAAIAEWQRAIGSHTRLFVRQETGLLCGETETWVIVEGMTVEGRSPLGGLDFIVGIGTLIAAICKKFAIDPDTARLIVYGGDLHPASEE